MLLEIFRARGREWVALPFRAKAFWRSAPSRAAENDTVILDPSLEMLPVEPAALRSASRCSPTVQAKAALLADAMRLTLRRGRESLRSAAQLRLRAADLPARAAVDGPSPAVPRLLIADDVGIGKTIEAGLILRELMDRGEVDAFSVLCPPHLVEQWVGELKSQFGIEAVAVTSGTAARLERGLPLAEIAFSMPIPYTVVSLDYIKADRRREGFARACPDFVIVDEAHACVGTHKGRAAAFRAFVRASPRSMSGRMILLTATPHSGDEEAFASSLPNRPLIRINEFRRRPVSGTSGATFRAAPSN